LKIVHLVGFTIEIYHDAGSYEYQNWPLSTSKWQWLPALYLLWRQMYETTSDQAQIA